MIISIAMMLEITISMEFDKFLCYDDTEDETFQVKAFGVRGRATLRVGIVV